MMLSARPSLSHARSRSWIREQKRFIQAVGRTAHEFGVGRLVGRVYALFLLEAKPLCLDEIMSMLSISKASASITLRRLAAWRLVYRVAVEKQRRDFYLIEADFLKVLREGVIPLATSKLANAGQMLERMLSVIPVPQSADISAGSVRQRLQEVKVIQEKLSFVLQSGLLPRFLQ